MELPPCACPGRSRDPWFRRHFAAPLRQSDERVAVERHVLGGPATYRPPLAGRPRTAAVGCPPHALSEGLLESPAPARVAAGRRTRPEPGCAIWAELLLCVTRPGRLRWAVGRATLF